MQPWQGHKTEKWKKILNIVRSMSLLPDGIEWHRGLVYNKIIVMFSKSQTLYYV